MYFQRELGIDAKGIFVMPWRRFRVFIDERLQKSEENEELYPPAAEYDWNTELDRSLGKQPARKRNIVTIDEYLGGGS